MFLLAAQIFLKEKSFSLASYFFFGFVVVVLGIFAINHVVCLSDVFVVTKCFRIVVILFSELAFYLTLQRELSQCQGTVLHLQVLYLNSQCASPPHPSPRLALLSGCCQQGGPPWELMVGGGEVQRHSEPTYDLSWWAGCGGGNKGRQLQLRTLHSGPNIFPAN